MNYALQGTIIDIELAASKALKLKTTLVEGRIEFANPKVGADLALPCFSFAGALKTNPTEVAAKLAKDLKQPAILKCKAAGPYLNIWLDPAFLAKRFKENLQEAERVGVKYGEQSTKNPQTVVVEFPSPNMAKPYSVGHLRPAIQGWAIRNLMLAMGNKVITDDHLGDSGTPFGKWVVGFLQYSSDEQLAKDGIYELARVYIQITKDLKDEKEAGGHKLADAVQDWLLKLEEGDAKAKSYSERFSKISLEHIGHIYKRLGISTDYAMGEAGFVADGKRLVAEYIKKGIAKKQPDGAVIVPLDGFDTPMLAQKSNGTANYATTDIAALDYRMRNWHPGKIIHVVGAEQQFHFNQLFALAKKLGYTKVEFVHYWFGIIDQLNSDGTRSKMSSRKGVILLEDMLDRAEEEARKHAPDPIHLGKESVRRIALGAVKFNDFAQDRKTNILFDWKTMFSLQGYSGPYIQYAAVRVGAILSKFGEGQFEPEVKYDWVAEHDVLLQLAKYPSVVEEAAKAYEPHRVASYLYDLARILNRYYEATNVGESAEPVRNLRLWLLKEVKNNLAHGLGILGIEIPENM